VRKCGRAKGGERYKYRFVSRFSTPAISFFTRAITLQTPPRSSAKQTFRFGPRGLRNVTQIISVLAECSIVCETWFSYVSALRSKTAASYLTNIDHVDIFDFQQNIFLAPLHPPGPALPDAGLRGFDSGLPMALNSSSPIRRLKMSISSSSKRNRHNCVCGGVPGFTTLVLRALPLQARKPSSSVSRRRRLFRRWFTCPQDESIVVSPSTLVSRTVNLLSLIWRAACSGHGRGRSRFLLPSARSRWFPSRRGVRRSPIQSVTRAVPNASTTIWEPRSDEASQMVDDRTRRPIFLLLPFLLRLS